MKQILIIIVLFFAHGASAQICVGTPGEVEWKFYDNLLDSYIEDLLKLPEFPNSPDTIKTLYRLETPSNYKSFFGALVEGFISVPQSGNVSFNVTGDDRVRFYLSSDDQPVNASLRCYSNSSTGSANHIKYPEQTSEEIFLQANEFYYFKLQMAEGTGSDYAKVFWQTDFLAPDVWHIITSNYINGVDCAEAVCPQRGLPCDDGNASTVDDKEDGNCNCVGKNSTSNSCVGERGKVFSYRYENLPGSNISGLYSGVNFPAMPDNGVALQYLTYPPENTFNEIGNQVQGFLTVPITGEYAFNVTGDDNTYFYLSSDEDVLNKENYSVHVPGWTNSSQHDKYPEQTGDYITLTKDTYYYYELNHKEGGGGENFSVQWKTPYSDTSFWKYIPNMLLYDYDCELACISAGVLCDDGNKFTNNDQFDANCECVGTPCDIGDCDDQEANFIPSESCAKNMQVDNREEDNWFSCTKTANPNPAYGDSHWIQYDLGDRYQLVGSTIWNYNGADHPEYGFESVGISVSVDGVNYTPLDAGVYNFPLADGTTPYSGFTGPSFNGIYAQYVLFTSLDQTGTCRGLGKVVLKGILCPELGSVCDDGDNNTILDQYNDICECKGVPLDANLCSEDYLTLGDQLLETNNFSAKFSVTSSGVVANTNKVSLIGGDFVELNTGFNSDEATVFLASVAECLEMGLQTPEGDLQKSIKKALQKEDEIVKQNRILVKPKGKNQIEVKYSIEEAKTINKIQIEDINGKVVVQLANYKHLNKGVYKKNITTERLETGIYTVKLYTPEGVFSDNLTVSNL